MRQSARIVAALGIAVCALLLVLALRFDAGLPGRPVSSSRVSAAGDAGEFPRHAIDASGRELRIAAAPQAIGSQALAIDHVLFAIADRDRLVSVSAYATDPGYSFVYESAVAMRLAESSDLEAVLRARPDLMLLSHHARADFEDVLQHAGIPTFRVRTIFANFDQIAYAIAAIGHVTGDDEDAEFEIRRLRERVERAKRRRQPGAPAPRVLPYSTYGSTLGDGSLFDHILTELGAINVAAEHGVGQYADISNEQVAAWDPEWIVAPADRGMTEQVRDRLLADVGIAATHAGRNGQILIVESRQFNSMSQHAASLMEAVADGLYGEGK